MAQQEISEVSKDGKIIFIVPAFDDKAEKDFIENVKALLADAPANVCVGIPKLSIPYRKGPGLFRFKKMEQAGGLDENSMKRSKTAKAVEKMVDYEIKKFKHIQFTFVLTATLSKKDTKYRGAV